MSWPTVTDLKTIKSKLAGQPDDKLRHCLNLAMLEIQNAFSSSPYNVSGWTTATPPLLKTLAIELAYGHAGRATHTGDRGTPSDNTAREVLTDARALLKGYASGAVNLVDADGNVIPKLTLSTGVDRWTEPVFGMKPQEAWGIYDATVPNRRYYREGWL